MWSVEPAIRARPQPTQAVFSVARTTIAEGQFGDQFVVGLGQRRKVRLVVELGLCHECRPLQGKDLAGLGRPHLGHPYIDHEYQANNRTFVRLVKQTSVPGAAS